MSIKKIMSVALPALAGVLVLGGLVAYKKEGSMEHAGEKFDDLAERISDKAEQAREIAGKKAEEAAEQVKERAY